MGDYVELEGVRTWYDDAGVGSPLVLLHGGLMTNESWFAQMPVFAREWHVYAPERRAHGRTPDVDGPISFDDMATDTIRFLESVVGEPASLVGWSHGGTVGLLVAIARPELVSKLVVIGTPFDTTGMVLDMNDMVAGMSHDAPEISVLRETYSAASPDGAGHWPTAFEKITAMGTKGPHIPIEDLKRVAAPVLVLLGDDDLVSLGHGVELFEALPNAAFGVIPFSSHRVLMEKPDIVNPMIVDFLKNDPAPTIMPIRRRPAEP
jgi:pimeloyl-ACP methyl ester carboxylesterase